MDVALSGAEEYLHLLMGTLESAISPRARSPMFAKSFRVVGGDMAWGWIADQITKKRYGCELDSGPESAQDRGHLCANHGINGQVSISVVYLQIQS